MPKLLTPATKLMRPYVLIVDDNPHKMVALQSILEPMDLSLVTSNSGTEALRHLLRYDFAVILLDVNIPDIDGFELAKLIRSHPRSEHTPIIFITSERDTQVDSLSAYGLGAVDYLTAPLVPEVLRAKVAVFVELYEKNQQLSLQADELAALNQELLAEKLREMTRMNAQLSSEIAERERAEQQLKELNDSLERIVMERTAEVEHRNRQLRALTAQLSQVEAQERKRIAHILHDELQQLLVAGKFAVAAVRGVPSSEITTITKQLEKLIDDSIQVSRSLTLDLSPPVLRQQGLYAAIDWLAKRGAEQHKLEVKVQRLGSEPDVPEEIKEPVFQAVRELLFNVVKHAQTNTASIMIDTREEEWLLITVEDNGTGFDTSLLDLTEGTKGIGLITLRERITWLGGHVEFRSILGKGTVTTLRLPMTAVEVGTSPTTPLLITTTAPRITFNDLVVSTDTYISVLLVDDHSLVREGLRSVINKQPDMRVTAEAGDGETAVALAREMRPQVIIMDINLPVMDGIAATREIKLNFPNIQIIGLSMHNEEGVAKAMRAAGACDYVTKDAASNILCDSIRRAVRKPAYEQTA